MADREGPVLPPNQNQNQNPNQNLNQNPNQVPDQIHLQIRIHRILQPLNAFMPNAPIVPEAPQRPQLYWSHFKSKFTGRPDEDWMDTHKFLEQVKVQRFCLTLVGEARLWYESLRLINIDWVHLQNISDSSIIK